MNKFILSAVFALCCLAGFSAESVPAEKTAPVATVTDSDIAKAKLDKLVWLNEKSHVFHRSDSRWYGRTKHGKFMTEEDALKIGGHVSGTKLNTDLKPVKPAETEATQE